MPEPFNPDKIIYEGREYKVKHSLLYLGRDIVGLPLADYIAHYFDFPYIEALIREVNIHMKNKGQNL